MGLWIVLGVVVALAAWAISVYNRLVALRNRFKNAFAQIDVQLKRRYDLIPNLVEAAKGYLAHERQTLEAVIAARGAAVNASQRAAAAPGNPSAMAGLAQAEGVLGGALGRLLAVFENYPDLKANQNILQVQEELASTENKVAFARQATTLGDGLKHAARDLPRQHLRRLFGFKEAMLLEATESLKSARPEGQVLRPLDFFDRQDRSRRVLALLLLCVPPPASSRLLLQLAAALGMRWSRYSACSARRRRGVGLRVCVATYWYALLHVPDPQCITLFSGVVLAVVRAMSARRIRN